MSYRATLKSCVLATTSVAVLGTALAVSSVAPAFAQDEEEAGNNDRVVVTGSRIRRQDYTANSPIVTVDASTFENTSTIGIETVLNQLPQFVPAATIEAGTQFSAGTLEARATQTPGASTVNLRGLGAHRSLVLIDGRRAMPLNAQMTVDTNTIPGSAIQRVEIISGGASATYGADAVGGVVNFILKDDFEGLNVDTQYGVTEIGDGVEFRISALVGATLADGRGSVMMGMEHSSRGKAFSWDRDWRMEELMNPYINTGGEFWYSEANYAPQPGNLPSQAFVNSMFTGSPPCPDGTPARPFVPVPSATGGPIAPAPTQPTAAVQPRNPALPAMTQAEIANRNALLLNACPSRPGLAGGNVIQSGVRNTDNFYVDGTTGRVFQITTAGGYRYPGIDASGFEYNDAFPGVPYRKRLADGSIQEIQQASYLSLPLERYSFFAKGEYEFTPNVRAYLNGQFASTETRTYSQFSPAVTSWGAQIPFGNDLYGPSLGPTAITGYNPTTGAPIYNTAAPTLAAYRAGGAYGLNCPAVGGCTQSEAFPMPAEFVALLRSRPQPDADLLGPGGGLQRNLDYLPQRNTLNRNSMYQVIAGLEGELANDWIWDVSLSHGQSEAVTNLNGFASLERYRDIAESPNFGRNFSAVGNEEFANFTGGAATCTTGLPILTDFTPSQDCVDAFIVNMQNNGVMVQNIGEANLSGDLFELPAGTLAFALGATYRENDYKFLTDTQTGLNNFHDQAIGLAAVGNTTGQTDVGEVYAELLIPVVRDLPFVREFNLEVGGRYSDYSSIGTEETFKILGDWTITDFARLRGGYNKATRAPNLGELFLGRTALIFGTPALFGDQCNSNATSGPNSADPNRNEDGAVGAAHTRAICQAIMGGAASQAATNYYNLRDVGADANQFLGQAYQKGNPNVGPETADTWTAGIVITSPLEHALLRGLNLTVDYYRIELDDIITTRSPDVLARACYGLDENPTQDITKPECQALARNPVTGFADHVDVDVTNEGWARFSGIDVQINWNAQLEDLGIGFIPGGVSINSQATFPIEQKTQVTKGDPAAGIAPSAINDWVGTQGCGVGLGCSGYDYTVFTTFNYFVGDVSASLRWQHRPSIDSAAIATNPLSYALGVHESYNLFSLSGSYRFNDTFTFRLGIENLLDNEPPLQGGSFNPASPSGFTNYAEPTTANPTPNNLAPAFPTLPTRAGGGLYDPLGRRFFLGVSASF